MTKPIIQIRNLTKRYRIGSKIQGDGLRHVVSDFLRKPWRVLSPERKSEELVALDDLSLDVEEGQILGVIGRNGAGKSTLLKILSRITLPSHGEITLRGRVACLLEVGTGFHPDLTGRENVYLNGAVLNMTRGEIDRKFDSIVDFSEVERFLDTPIKRYSSGMTVRLAFAVAAHLEPEILAVDEVLAVGDTAFQKKCLGQMKDVALRGRTVLFVTHNMAAVNALCTHGLLLHHGAKAMDGPIDKVVSGYLEQIESVGTQNFESRHDRVGDGRLRFVDYQLEQPNGDIANAFRSGEDAIFALRYKAKAGGNLRNVSIAIGLVDPIGNVVTELANRIAQEEFAVLPEEGVIRCHVECLPLMPSRYSFAIFSRVNGVIADWFQVAGHFDVEAGEFFKTGKLLDEGHGYMLMHHSWSVEDIQVP